MSSRLPLHPQSQVQAQPMLRVRTRKRFPRLLRRLQELVRRYLRSQNLRQNERLHLCCARIVHTRIISSSNVDSVVTICPLIDVMVLRYVLTVAYCMAYSFLFDRISVIFVTQTISSNVVPAMHPVNSNDRVVPEPRNVHWRLPYRIQMVSKWKMN
jgi:hypothetical protein